MYSVYAPNSVRTSLSYRSRQTRGDTSIAIVLLCGKRYSYCVQTASHQDKISLCRSYTNIVISHVDYIGTKYTCCSFGYYSDSQPTVNIVLLLMCYMEEIYTLSDSRNKVDILITNPFFIPTARSLYFHKVNIMLL